MIQIKKKFFAFLVFVFLGLCNPLLIQAQDTAKNSTEVVEQKSIIEEPRIIYLTIEEAPHVIELFIKEEEEKKQTEQEPKIEQKVTCSNQYAVIINSLTQQEKELICRIAYLEAGNQCVEGQRAVIEVILNRVIKAEWPGTVEGVLSAPHQFSTWKNRNKVSNEQIIQMNNILNIVSCSNDTVLPNINYVYFNNSNGSKNSIKIQGHWFWT